MDCKTIIRRKTVQRELVLNAIKSGEHPTARTIYTEVCKVSSISFGTVYRNLQILVESGDVLQIQSGESAHYDKKCIPHYHLHCAKCGGVFDMPVPYHAELDADAERASGFSIKSHMISFEGLCANCAVKNAN